MFSPGRPQMNLSAGNIRAPIGSFGSRSFQSGLQNAERCSSGTLPYPDCFSNCTPTYNLCPIPACPRQNAVFHYQHSLFEPANSAEFEYVPAPLSVRRSETTDSQGGPPGAINMISCTEFKPTGTSAMSVFGGSLRCIATPVSQLW